MYPKAVLSTGVYSGWSACRMKALGAKPLWRGITKGTRQVLRFVFTQGHGTFSRVVTISEREDGQAVLSVTGIDHEYRQPEERLPPRRIALSSEDMARLNRLGEETGVWEFEIGSWDGDEIYMHCQVLEMERANPLGYRYSSVNIGCNHPAKLMPLVDEVVRLARLKTLFDGRLYQ